jgi:DNA-binding PadR family transcriptional regulator
MRRRRVLTAEISATVLSDLAFHVLLALGTGPLHGYAIGKRVEEQSAGRLDPTTGALYQALRRLTEDGFIAPADAPTDTDARRRYFVLTRTGRQAAANEARRLEALVRAARERKLYPQRA